MVLHPVGVGEHLVGNAEVNVGNDRDGGREQGLGYSHDVECTGSISVMRVLDNATVIGPVFSERTCRDIEQVVSDARIDRTDYDPTFVRYQHHNLKPLVDVHHSLTEAASELFKVRLKPSYVFLSHYLEGGRCGLHLDRPMCFKTIDVMVRRDSDDPWPIRISETITDEQREYWFMRRRTASEENDILTSGEWSEVHLKPNEAVCYSGTHQWHYRPDEATGRTDLIFFHFVPEDYEGSLD